MFAEWNKGELDSYLIEITRDILGFKDEDGQPLVDKILDTAGQKGTGKWTGIEALELGIPLTLIGEAVFARCLSAIKEERVLASKVLPGPKPKFEGDRKAFVEDIRKALYASKMVSYAQGYTLMRAAAQERGWNLNYGGVALMWRGGCIIRSVFLGKIKEAFDANPGLTNLLLDPFFRDKVVSSQEAWRARRLDRDPERGPGAGVRDRPRLLRRLPRRAAAGEPAAGPARLLRRPHVRAHGPAAREVLPHQLDRPRRHDVGLDLHGVRPGPGPPGYALAPGAVRGSCHPEERGPESGDEGSAIPADPSGPVQSESLGMTGTSPSG